MNEQEQKLIDSIKDLNEHINKRFDALEKIIDKQLSDNKTNQE